MLGSQFLIAHNNRLKRENTWQSQKMQKKHIIQYPFMTKSNSKIEKSECL